MKIKNQLLIDELVVLTDQAIDQVTRFLDLDIDTLNYKPNAGTWSMLESIEHLNLYGNFYLPEIERQLAKAQPKSDCTFSSGLFGDYFVNLIRVKKGSIKKIKTMRKMDPSNPHLTYITLNRFIKQQEKLKSLLIDSLRKDITKTKTAISLTHFIRLRMGDTLRFVVYHTERHMLQARHALEAATAALGQPQTSESEVPAADLNPVLT
ncbi:MAG: DinB family protein [Chitinophagaceae bacterium]|nr:MAG: DinB family protein [Chitinophagaceae bacterium]